MKYLLGQLSSVFQVLSGKCEIKWKKPNFVKNISFLKYWETLLFATLNWPFATCGEWRMGWTTLS
jgi:hypothetical protein